VPYHWSVQAVDGGFAGSPFSAEGSFKFLPVPAPVSASTAVAGDADGDGLVSQSELDTVLSSYLLTSPWLEMTNVAGLGGTNVVFALTNFTGVPFSVEYTTDLLNWDYLGPTTPRYEFTDTNAPAIPERFYRLRWP
jgi:hypothetical protein